MAKRGKKTKGKFKGKKGLPKDFSQLGKKNVLGFSYTADAWKKFYASPAGQARLTRLKNKKDGIIKHKLLLLVGGKMDNVGTQKQVTDAWKASQNRVIPLNRAQNEELQTVLRGGKVEPRELAKEDYMDIS
jgi:hypothetical protein